jgi:hypothetical protein
MSDGRTFVSDGGLALDAAIAKPAALPAVVLGPASAKVLEGYMAAPLKNEFTLADLGPAATGRTYTAPSGVVLNSTYVDYLRRTFPAGRVRLRMKSDLEPIVIVADGAAVGLLMPVKR